MNKRIRANLLSIFRLAIPDISPEAEIVFVDRNPWKIPNPWYPRDLEIPDPGPQLEIKLEPFDVPGPGSSRLSFTIARYIPDPYDKKDYVLALRLDPEELVKEYQSRYAPDEYIEYLRNNDFYVKQYIPAESLRGME